MDPGQWSDIDSRLSPVGTATGHGMLGEFAAVLSRLNPASGDSLLTEDVPRGSSAAESDGDPVGLFECPSCGAVYIARDKQRCAACAVAVDSVDATY